MRADDFHALARVEVASACERHRAHWHAGPHPYTGRWLVALTLSLANEVWREEGPRGADELADTFLAGVRALRPLYAHAHDADEHAIQNTQNPDLLRLGYGFHEELPPWNERAGREENRGHWRLLIAWCTWLGPELIAWLAEDADLGVLSEGQELAGGRFFRLSRDPDDHQNATFLQHRAMLFTGLGFSKRAQASAKLWAYWQRTPR